MTSFWQLLGPQTLVLISTAIIGILDSILSSSGNGRDYGYFYLHLVSRTGLWIQVLASSCFDRDSGY